MSRDRHHSRAVLAAIGDGRSSRRVNHHDHNTFYHDHHGGIVHDNNHRALLHDDNHRAPLHHDDDCLVHDDHNRSLHDHHDHTVSRPRY